MRFPNETTRLVRKLLRCCHFQRNLKKQRYKSGSEAGNQQRRDATAVAEYKGFVAMHFFQSPKLSRPCYSWAMVVEVRQILINFSVNKQLLTINEWKP